MTSHLELAGGGVNAAAMPAKDTPNGVHPAPGAPASPPAPLVVGVDLSLRATGIAHLTPTGLVTDTVTVTGDGIIRLRRIARAVKEHSSGARLVVVEGPSYASHGRGSHERAGLWWLVADLLWRAGIPVAVVPPSSLKKYALGVGGGTKSGKDYVISAAVRRLPDFHGGNDEADAAWLAAMGLDHLTGQHYVPDAHRTALTGAQWPDLTRYAS